MTHVCIQGRRDTRGRRKIYAEGQVGQAQQQQCAACLTVSTTEPSGMPCATPSWLVTAGVLPPMLMTMYEANMPDFGSMIGNMIL